MLQLNEAVTAAISGESWEIARAIARDHAPLKAKLEEAYQYYLVRRKETGKQQLQQHQQLEDPGETVLNPSTSHERVDTIPRTTIAIIITLHCKLLAPKWACLL